MKIDDILDLREHAIGTLEKLESKKITIEEAGVTGKIYEGIISTLKTQLEYAKMLKRDPYISFLENSTFIQQKTIHTEKVPLLQHKKSAIKK